MHKIPFSQLQRAIAAGGELQTRSEAHEAEMRLTIAEEAALEEWCLAMYRWGSPVRCHACRWGLALGQSQRQEGGQSHTKPPAGASSVGFGVV